MSTRQLTKDSLDKVANDNEFPTELVEISTAKDLLRPLKRLARSVNVDLNTILSDQEVAKVARAWLLSQPGAPDLLWSAEREVFVAWEPSTRAWKIGKQVNAREILGQFVTTVRDLYLKWSIAMQEQHKAAVLAVEAATEAPKPTAPKTIDPAKLHFGKLAAKYLGLSGLSTLVEAYKIPSDHQVDLGDFDGPEFDELALLKNHQGSYFIADFRTKLVRPATKKDKLTMLRGYILSDNGEKVNKLLTQTDDDWFWQSKTGQVVRHVYTNNEERMRLHQRVLGYSLVKGNKEQILVLLFGNPRSGKGVLMDSHLEFQGRCGVPINSKVLCDKGTDVAQDGYELGHLENTNLFYFSEFKKGDTFNDGLMKLLTGGRRVPLRVIRGDVVYGRRTWTPIGDTNYLPKDKDATGAIANRTVILWGTGQTKLREERDKELLEDIIAQEGEIQLAWYMRGAYEALHNGLQVLSESEGTNPEIMRQMSRLADFMSETNLVADREMFIPLGALKMLYTTWAEDNVERKYRSNWTEIRKELLKVSGGREGKRAVDGKEVRCIIGLGQKGN